MRPFVAPPNVPTPADAFASDVEYYLALDPPQLPSRYLYDALGSVLFEAICELPWYGITRAEFSLLEKHRAAILAQASLNTRLSRIVELGPGNGTKLRTLLEEDADRLANGGVYGRADRRLRGREVHLIDVSGKALDQAVKALSPLERIEVIRHEATYEDGLHEIAEAPDVDGSTLILFLGSNIGNFDRPGAEEFLRTIRAALKPGDSLLLGADLVKPEGDLLLAYDDPLGVTAAFNRNLLVRINRELGGDVDLDAFGHRAVWNAVDSRVEMHLVSRRRQRVRIPAAHVDITLDAGDTIWTESSYKYGPEELDALLGSAGFDSVDSWIAPRERFALLLVRAA
jgi:L-histidine N-alpha-methyltransferase